MTQWFTIRSANEQEFSEDKHDNVKWGQGTCYATITDAYDVAVELSYDEIKVWFHTNLDGNVRSSIVWESAQ